MTVDYATEQALTWSLYTCWLFMAVGAALVAYGAC
jgi:hypothetical protein